MTDDEDTSTNPNDEPFEQRLRHRLNDTAQHARTTPSPPGLDVRDTRGRSPRVAVMAGALIVVLAVVGVLALSISNDKSEEVLVAIDTQILPSTTESGEQDQAVPTEGLLQVDSHQTGCCFAEGSWPFLEVFDTAGAPMGPLIVAEPPLQELDRDENGEEQILWAFPEVLLPFGTYELVSFQLVCPADGCLSGQDALNGPDADDRTNVCSTTITLSEATPVLMLTNAWHLSEGCTSFE